MIFLNFIAWIRILILNANQDQNIVNNIKKNI
jgi:hypothetical protein